VHVSFPLSIGDAAREAGVSTRALRYYEEMSLLRPAAYSAGGHRLYGPAELTRVARIRELQDLMGFNLAEIAGVLANEDRLDSLRDAFHRVEDGAERHRILEEALAVLDALDEQVTVKQRRLAQFRRQIAARRARAEAAGAEMATKEVVPG